MGLTLMARKQHSWKRRSTDRQTTRLLKLEELEPRQMLSANPVTDFMLNTSASNADTSTSTPSGYTPAQIRGLRLQ